MYCFYYVSISTDEHEQRSMIEPQSREDPKLKELIKVKLEPLSLVKKNVRELPTELVQVLT